MRSCKGLHCSASLFNGHVGCNLEVFSGVFRAKRALWSSCMSFTETDGSNEVLWAWVASEQHEQELKVGVSHVNT